MRASRRLAVCIVAALAVWPAAASSATAATTVDQAVDYRPPVDAEVTDTFRPPATAYGAGNRGIDYATTAGQAVHAAADGEVVFAGRIGATHHVTVLHDDSVRTSYSFLSATSVRRGQRVEQGQPVGTASDIGVHFGARAGDAYVDPLVLFGQTGSQGTTRAWLVDDPDPTEALTEAQERRIVIEALRGLRNAATRAVDHLADQTAQAVQRKIELLRVLADDAIDLGLPMPVHLAIAAARWREDQHTCTPATSPVPTDHTRHRRIVILVGGLGSATGNAAVLDTDTTQLGYDQSDVHQFSYRPEGQPYGPEDTQGDIGDQAERLAAEIAGLQRANPDTPVDVIAHSQGGLVARAAITIHRARPATLVTLGTPHQGTDVATAAVGLDGTTSGHLLLDGATLATKPTAGLDLNSRSIQQMAETSRFITRLPEDGWDPATTHVVSVAARADPIVPNHQSRLHTPHAASTVVTPHGTSTAGDHAAIVGSPEATREIGRALNRQPPTCRTLDQALVDTFVGHRISITHDSVGAALTAAALYADHRTKQLLTTR